MRCRGIGPLGQRSLYGWCAAATIPFAGLALASGLAYSVAFASTMVLVSLFLSFLALWQTVRVEVAARDDVVDPKTD